jgi:hypothetical protein
VTTSGSNDTTISTRLLTRILILMIAVWSAVCGAVLFALHGAATGALGAGVTDQAGQRLLGAHLIILTPAYLLLAWKPDRYSAFLWLPFASQLAVAITVGYSILGGETDAGDGILAVAVSGIFAALMAFVWVNERRATAQAQLNDDSEHRKEPGTPGWDTD